MAKERASGAVAERRKETFGPVPLRAVPICTGLEMKVLTVVAAHDQFSENGKGCYATQRRIAAMIGCDHVSVSRTLKALVDKGLLKCTPSEKNPHLKTYRVIYTDTDKALMDAGSADPCQLRDVNVPINIDTPHPPVSKRKGPSEKLTAPSTSRPPEMLTAATTSPPEKLIPEKVDVDFGESANGSNPLSQKEDLIPKREEKRYYEIGREFRETARSLRSREEPAWNRREPNDGAFMALVERALRVGGALDQATRENLEQISDSRDRDDPLRRQAERLLSDYDT